MTSPPKAPSFSSKTKLSSMEALRRLLSEKESILDKKEAVIQSQKARIAFLEEQLHLQKIKRFSASSEQNPQQLSLFNEAEEIDGEQDQAEPEPEDKPKKKKPSGRKGLNPDVPRVQQRIELSEVEKDGAIETYFVKVKEELDIVPAQVQVIEIMQEKAVFLNEANERKLISAPLPRHPLPKAVASINTLAYIIVAKYMDALPLYRLEKILSRYGGSVTRTTLANWLIRLAERLTPLINLIREHQWEGKLIQADETRIQVLKEPERSITSDKWMWVTRGGPPGQASVLFEYDPSRSQEIPLRLLEGFSGYLQTDGYAGYNAVVKKQKLIQAGCWDHARRKFDEADKAARSQSKKAKGKSKSKSSAPSKACIALSKINKLYLIEREIKDQSPAEKLRSRQERSLPILNDLKSWLEKNQTKVLKDSLTSKAICYTLNQWEKLSCYCEHGEIPISNILAENAIRPFCVGRRNWLFSDTPKGAHASALYYSLIETAKANGLEPYEYFRVILKQLPYADTVEKMEALLPWNINIEQAP
jgi:transposase